MGNCRSQPTSVPSSSLRHGDNNAVHSNNDAISNAVVVNGEGGAPSPSPALASDTTAALLQALLPTVLPVVCQMLSRQLVLDPAMTILCNEEPVVLPEEEKDDKNKSAKRTTDASTAAGGDPPVVIRGLSVTISQIALVNAATIQSEMTQMPTFAWPERERVAELMMNDNKGSNNSNNDSMTVLDLCNVNIKISLGNGIEFVVPVQNSMGIPVTLEVGCGGDVVGNDAWFACAIPKLRLWIVRSSSSEPQQDQLPLSSSSSSTITTPTKTATTTTTTTKAYIAFFGRPNLTPHVHINADRGKGDFFDMNLVESGSLDDVIESVLMGFWPTEVMKASQSRSMTNSKPESSWVGDALGKQISKVLGSFVGIGNNRPYEVDLTEAVTDAMDAALGKQKPRPVEDVQADMERLQIELEKSKQYYELLEQQQRQQQASTTETKTAATTRTTQNHPIEEKKDDDGGSITQLASSVAAPFMACCGQ